MGKGRKRILTEEDIANIIEAFQIDTSLTKREVVIKYQISLTTLYKYLPHYLKPIENFRKKDYLYL